MEEITSQVRPIFVEAQHSMHARTKLISRLLNVREKNENNFFESFTEHVKHSLVVFTREPAVERTIDFLVAFASAAESQEAEKKRGESRSFEDVEEDEQMSQFLIKFLNFLLDCHDSKLKAVRFRACQLINKLLNILRDDVSIDEDLADRIYDCMLIRLRDKFPSIRVQAVLAIYRLQDIQDENCPVVNSFIDLMEKDSNADVRRAALCNIALTPKTLQPVLGRTRDVKEVVRKTAYEVLAVRVRISSLTIAQRLKLLQNGVNDRSSIVKKACVENLLKSWLSDRDNRVDHLLKCFHVESSPDVVSQTLKALLEGTTNDDFKKHIEALKSLPQDDSEPNAVKIAQDSLEPENAIYWRHLAQHVKSLKDHASGFMDQILPLASEFCDYVQKFADNHKLVCSDVDEDDEQVQQDEFIMQQLLELCGCLDYSDEIGRVRMQCLTRKLLISENVPYTLVQNLVARFAETEPGEEVLVQSLVEIISEIKEPMVVQEIPQNPDSIMKRKLEMAKLRVKLNELKETLDDFVKTEDFSKAAEIKEEITKVEQEIEEIKEAEQSTNQTVRVENNDPMSILKCLYIASEMLQKMRKRESTPTIKSLADTLIWPSVQNPDLLIRNAAVKCLGLYSLLSKEYAAGNFVLFLQAAQIDEEMVQITSIQVIVDLLQVFGFEAFEIDHAQARPITMQQDSTCETPNDTTADDTTADNTITANPDDTELVTNASSNEEFASASNIILNVLMRLMDGESQDTRFVVVEGICKLLLSGRVRSAKLFARLVLLWFNPVVEDDVNLRQCIGVFLPAFAFASRANQELIEGAFLSVVATLYNAPDTSPLIEVNPVRVVELLAQLTSTRHQENHVANLVSIPGNQTNTTIKETYVHDSLADRIANEILTERNNCDVRTLCKALSLLEISPANQTAIRDLQVFCDRLLGEEDDKVSKRFIQKFQAGLRLVDQTAVFDASQSDSVATTTTERTIQASEDERTELSSQDANRTITDHVTETTDADATADRTLTNDAAIESSQISKRKSQSVAGTLSKRRKSNRKRKMQTQAERKRQAVNYDSDATSSEEEDEDPIPRVSMRISARAPKRLACEEAKLNLESILNDDSDSSNKASNENASSNSD